MPNNPYPIRYVLTDADHMAATFDALERALYERDALTVAEDEGDEVDDAHAQQARESVGEHISGMRRAVHEYRKRAERYRASVASAAPADHSEAGRQMVCKSCGGNNADVPCAYPEGGQPHCLRAAPSEAREAWAVSLIQAAIDLMTIDQIGRWTGVRAFLESSDDVPSASAAALTDAEWLWMTHPTRNNGKPIPVRIVTAEDSSKWFIPFDEDGCEFEWSERDEDWRVMAASPANHSGDSADMVAIPPIMYNGDTKRDPALRLCIKRWSEDQNKQVDAAVDSVFDRPAEDARASRQSVALSGDQIKELAGMHGGYLDDCDAWHFCGDRGLLRFADALSRASSSRAEVESPQWLRDFIAERRRLSFNLELYAHETANINFFLDELEKAMRASKEGE
jgi:hypothetical protein